MDTSHLQPLGNYPESWARMVFDQFTTLKRGKDLTRDQFCDGWVPVAGSNGVIGFHNTANVKAPGITVGRSGSVGRVTFFAQDFWAHNTALFVTDFHGNDARFASYFLDFLRLGRFGSGASVPTLDRNSFRLMSVVVPPLTEQLKIAKVLGLVQGAMEQQERLIALTTELKKALLHQIFTQGRRGERQKETEIGLVPETWIETSLGQLASEPGGFLQTGPFGSQLHKHEYLGEGVGVVNPTHLLGNRINHADVPRVSQETAARLNRHLLNAGDILFARRGEIGRHGMVTRDEEGWLCGTGCFLARIRQKHIDNRFLSYLFSTDDVIAWLNSHAAGAIMPNLNNTILRSMPVFFPSKETIHERKLASLTALLRTLLHQLMTAQIRVHNLNLPEMESAIAA